ncbi:MAG: MATE family efflux transporter [Bacteroidales bacterium]
MDIKRDSINFGKTDVSRLYRKLLFPTLIGLIFTITFTLTDGIFVGLGIGSDALAAINIVAPIFLIGSGTGLLFGTGASVLASIHLAKKNVKAARIICTQAIIIPSILIIIITSICSIFSRQLAYLLGSSDKLLPYVLDYMRIILPSFFLIVILNVGTFIVRLDGSPKYATACDIISSVINIILNYIFVFKLKLGVQGVASATIIGITIGSTLMLIYIIKYAKVLKYYKLKWTKTAISLHIRNIGYLIKTGFPTFLGEATIAWMILIGNYIFLKLAGEDGVAAFSIACYYMPIIFMINDAIIQSAQPIISYNYGLKKKKRIKKAIYLAYGSALGVAVIMTAFYIIEDKMLVSIFIKKGCGAFDLAIKGIPYFSTGYLFIAFNVASIGIYQAIKKPHLASFFSVLRGFIFLTLCFIICPLIWGIKGAWLAVTFAEGLTTIIIVFYLIRKKFKFLDHLKANNTPTVIL